MLGAGLSLAFAIAIFLSNQFLEDHLAEAMLNEEMDAFLGLSGEATWQVGEFQLSRRLRVFLTPAEGETSLPPWLVGLEPGMHERVGPDGQVYHLLVREVSGWRVVLAHDVTRFEARQHALTLVLLACAALATYLAIWIGWLLSHRVIVPVTRLADAVAELSWDAADTSLRSRFPDDEVGRLAGVLDDSRSQLRDALIREREYSADVSHELRTPLAIIAGAVEVLRDEDRCSPGQAHRLARIQRAADEMRRLIEVFLLLSRNPSDIEPEECQVLPLISGVLEAELAALPRTSATVTVSVPPTSLVFGPCRVVSIVAANLVRNALRHATGPVEVSVRGACLVIRDSGHPGDEEEPRNGSRAWWAKGSGRGLPLVRRLCQHYGWTLDLALTSSGGTEAIIDFGNSLTCS